MIEFSGADVVLPDRVLSPGTVVIDGDRIVDVRPGSAALPSDRSNFRLTGHFIVPGFVDVHVHGVEGADTLDGGDAVRQIASRLPRFGVTAFCPTSIACSPAALRSLLTSIRDVRVNPSKDSARVLPAHLESNFISPDFKGAQPLECLRLPSPGPEEGDFTGAEILAEIDAARPDVGIITLAPELDGALDLIRTLAANGHRVSLGHSGATYEEGVAGIEAGARQATHLFNRMTSLSHRAPGLAGAVLEHEDVVAEVICDGVHVHPAVIRVALAAKGPSAVMAITDGTAGSGLPQGSRATLGGRAITVKDVAYLDDGTIAGSVLTMDQAFRMLVLTAKVSLIDAVMVASTTPARALQLAGHGVISTGSVADLAILDRDLRVVQTWIGGRQVWCRGS
jgi:N-acetylglucosamine-6-phosphate deacetylase